MATATLDNLALDLTEEIQVHASLDATFEALLDQMGPGNEGAAGVPMPMVLEARPGGRWFRDLGGNDGHFWGLVQAITGPLFMSMPVVSNIQYRLKAVDGGTLIAFRHSALGFIPEDLKQGLSHGWTALHGRVQKQAAARR